MLHIYDNFKIISGKPEYHKLIVINKKQIRIFKHSSKLNEVEPFFPLFLIHVYMLHNIYHLLM